MDSTSSDMDTKCHMLAVTEDLQSQFLLDMQHILLELQITHQQPSDHPLTLAALTRQYRLERLCHIGKSIIELCRDDKDLLSRLGYSDSERMLQECVRCFKRSYFQVSQDTNQPPVCLPNHHKKIELQITFYHNYLWILLQYFETFVKRQTDTGKTIVKLLESFPDKYLLRI